MRHLKVYKMFESNDLSLDHMNDILNDLVDNGLGYSINSHNASDYIKFNPKEDRHFLLRIFKSNQGLNLSYFKYSDVQNTLTHFVSYVEDHGFNISECKIRPLAHGFKDITNNNDFFFDGEITLMILEFYK